MSIVVQCIVFVHCRIMQTVCVLVYCRTVHACCVHCQFSANTVCASVVVRCMCVVSVARLMQTVCVFVVFFGCTSLTPSCFQRGSGGDRDPRRWGKGRQHTATLSVTTTMTPALR